MANGMYAHGKEGILDGTIVLLTDNLKITLIDEADDTIDLAADEDWADRAAASRVADSGNLASKAVLNGTFDAADVTFSSATGDQAESIDCRQDTGTEATSRLIFNIDTATGLPVTPNGGDITVTWDTTIFSWG